MKICVCLIVYISTELLIRSVSEITLYFCMLCYVTKV